MDSQPADSSTPSIAEYVRSVFELVGQAIPRGQDDRPDWTLAFNMTCHWAALGHVTSYGEWQQLRHPPEPDKWPAGLAWPPEHVSDA